MEEFEQKVNNYYESLSLLGFKLNQDDILDVNIDKNDARVSFKKYDKESGLVIDVEKKFNDITPDDIVDAYNLHKDFTDDSEKLLNAFKVVAECTNNENKKIVYNNVLVDNLKKDNNTGKFDFVLVDNKKNEIVKVENEEEVKDSEFLNKAKAFIKNNSAYIIAGAILVGAIAYAAISNSKDNSSQITKETNIETENTMDNMDTDQEELDLSFFEEIPEEDKEVIAENGASEEVQEEVVEEVQEENLAAEEEAVELDIHSDEAILASVDKIYDSIQELSDENLKLEMDKDTIEAFVRYTHHNYTEYSGYNIISNEYAYEKFSQLFLKGYNVANFYENLDNYERINNLVTKCQSISEEKNSYDDEYNAFKAMGECVDNLNAENYPEAIIIRAVADNTTDIPSMKILANGAIEENGLEGEEYNAEKKSVADISSECTEIFKKVDFNNENATLTQVTYKAIEEDETLNLGR